MVRIEFLVLNWIIRFGEVNNNNNNNQVHAVSNIRTYWW